MSRREERYAEIAASMRKQQVPALPLKHEWLELITRLSLEEDPSLRELGVDELIQSAARTNRSSHV